MIRYRFKTNSVWVTARGCTLIAQMGQCTEISDWYDEEGDFILYHDTVTAWMPYFVPEPWKGGGE